MTLPNWAKTLFIITEEGTKESYNTENLTDEQITYLLDLFTIKKEALKQRCQNTPYPSTLETNEIEKLASEYSICNIGFALVDLERLKRLTSSPDRNLGTGSQHWIPECYMKAFSKDFGTKKPNLKVNKVAKRLDSSLLEDGTQTRLIGIPTRIKGSEFRENRAYKGTFYTPEFEKVLGCFETDYSKIRDTISLNTGKPSELWEFIVLATFFAIFSLRTRERMELVHTEAEINAGLLTSLVPQLLGAFPKLIARSDLRLIHRTRVLPEANQFIHYLKNKAPMKFPFTQNPFFIEKGSNGIAIWSVYSPNYLFLLEPKDVIYDPAVHKITNLALQFKTSSVLSNKLANIIQNSDYRHLYFHPDDTIWNILLEHNPSRKTEVIETSHIGNGPLTTKWTTKFPLSKYESLLNQMNICMKSEPPHYNIENRVIHFQFGIIRQREVKLSCRIVEVGTKLMMSVITSQWPPEERVLIEVRTKSPLFYSNFILR